MPAAWAYLLTVTLLGLLSSHPLTSSREMLSCVLFYNNYCRSLESMCGHFWSLSLEEQFYIVWPCLLLFAGVKRARWVAGIGALACATYRWVYLDQYTNPQRAYETQVRVDALLIGCLLALLLRDQRVRQWTRRWIHLGVAPALGIVALCFARSTSIPPLSESVAIAVLISFTMLKPQTMVARLLELRPIVVVGIGSYSLYLWQQLFISTHSAILFSAGSVIMAFVSYNLIEKPCIKLGSTILERKPILDRKRLLPSLHIVSADSPRSGVCPTRFLRSANSPAGSTSDS
jgi:peptidoglycan/LPS O-acetylase OafA/YrhL